MRSDFHNRNGDETYKFCEICYQTEVVCRRKPRIVEGIRRERQNRTQHISPRIVKTANGKGFLYTYKSVFFTLADMHVLMYTKSVFTLQHVYYLCTASLQIVKFVPFVPLLAQVAQI